MNQRHLCRSLFLMLCVAPTLAVASWTVASFSPAWHTAQLQQLGRQLGVRIECHAVESPRPGVLRLYDARLVEPELDAVLAHCDWLECHCAGETVCFTGQCLTIEAERRSAVASLIDRLLRSDWLPGLRFEVNRIEVEDAQGRAWATLAAVQVALDDLAGETTDQANARELQIQGNVAGEAHSAWRLTATRNRQLNPPATHVEIQTGPAGLPWRLLAGESSGAASEQAQFTGAGRVTFAGRATHGSLSGQLQGVALATWAPGVELHSPATIRIGELRWSDQRLLALDASLAGGRGAIDRRLVYAVHHQMRCGSTDRLSQDWAAQPDAPITFDELAISLQFDETGLHVRGGCRDAAGQTMPALLARDGEPLLYHPADGPLPAAAIERLGDHLSTAAARRCVVALEPAMRR